MVGTHCSRVLLPLNANHVKGETPKSMERLLEVTKYRLRNATREGRHAKR